MRLDKWLWAARFFKTRRLAVEAINKNQIKVNNDNAKPSRLLKIGDMLIIHKAQELFVVQVQSLPETRGPAKIAILSYEETEESVNKRMEAREMKKLTHTPKPEKAPDKKSRRLLREMRQQS